MRFRKTSKIKWLRVGLSGLLIFVVFLSSILNTSVMGDFTYAIPPGDETVQEEPGSQENETPQEENEDANTEEESEKPTVDKNNEKTVDGCKKGLGPLSWLTCPLVEKVADATDWIYSRIEGVLSGFLQIGSVSSEEGSAIRQIWEHARTFTNAVFIMFFLVLIYSQLTGYGISNYGIKKSLPKVIVVAILINLSFLICSVAIDISNIIGNGLRGIFTSVQEAVLNATEVPVNEGASMVEMYKALAQGTALVVGGGAIVIDFGLIWMFIPMVLSGFVSVVIGLITISLRQAVVALLVMISPLAFVAYMLPNTEAWFKRWKDLLFRMLVFYPMFSLLFGASGLAGFAILSTAVAAKDGFGIMLGICVQIFPLFFSWKLMSMSGTFLSSINARLHGLTATPLATTKAWADTQRRNKVADTIAHGVTPAAGLMRFMERQRALREENAKNVQSIIANKNAMYVNRMIADSEIGETKGRSRRTSSYTRNAKEARNYELMAKNAAAHTDHVMGKYRDYFGGEGRDGQLADQSTKAWIDYGRSVYQKEFDDEDDINFLVAEYLKANERDENNNPVHEADFNRYVRSVISGPHGEERLLGKIIKQAGAVESKQRAEINISLAKYGLNGDNKKAFREWLVGYKINDDGWAVDANGDRLKDNDGNFVELVQGDAITKAPEKLVLYNKRDEHGIYFDMKDQDGAVVSRVYRGQGADGKNHDDAAYIKEILSNWDIPISDPINNVYGILSGIKPGSIVTPQGQNDIGLSRYSTTIARAMGNYKGDASWAGAMFNTGIGNRQIHNSAQYAIWVLDSIKKTLKPGAFNTQNPAAVEYLRTILNPDNWDKVFSEEEIRDAVNINNELFGGEDWITDDEGNIVGHRAVDNPTYEQRMNTLKRKLIIPALTKILPAFDRLRTSNTADNQKPGTADEEYKLLTMIVDKYVNDRSVPFDPTLVDQDLQLLARDFRQQKHDRDGNLIYTNSDRGRSTENLLNSLEELYVDCTLPDELRQRIRSKLSSRREYGMALQRFNELCLENPGATMQEMYGWFVELDGFVQ